MLASSPASILNQNLTDLGIPNRFTLNSSRFKDGPNVHAVTADYVFDGAVVHESAAVVIHGTHIAQVVLQTELPLNVSVRKLPSGIWLAPGFIDLQVNGGGDVLFNDQPTSQGLCTIAAAHRRFGTTGFLPTLISDSQVKMQTA